MKLWRFHVSSAGLRSRGRKESVVFPPSASDDWCVSAVIQSNTLGIPSDGASISSSSDTQLENKEDAPLQSKAFHAILMFLSWSEGYGVDNAIDLAIGSTLADRLPEDFRNVIKHVKEKEIRFGNRGH